MKPSAHILTIVALAVLNLVGHIALLWSGRLHGYQPSMAALVRDVALFVPFVAATVWLVRTQKFKGNLTLLTAAVLLFTCGQLAQYRLFSDPEYGARGEERRAAREAKVETVLRNNIASGYDNAKKELLFGSTEVPPPPNPTPNRFGIFDALTSGNTLVPLASLAAMLAAFLFFRRDEFLLLLQKNAFLIGLATVVPFLVLVVFFSRGGKFLGSTTPWEPVKLLFLVTYGGLLADNYVSLGRTRWGLPPLRFLLPLGVAALLPVIPFFLLGDFGQMLVFGGVYVLLYFVAVRRWSQVAYAVAVAALLFPIFSLGIGIPDRIHLRFHIWLHTWEPPAEDAFWWKPYAARIREQYGDRPITNQDAWFDQSSQIAQGLFGLTEGQVTGEGLGLGFPEVVPVSDSDFVYTTLGEELGLVGCAALLTALCAFVVAGVGVARDAGDMFTKLLAAGFTAFVGFQALVNVGGVIRLLPMTGITLPFVSHGGWSLITSFAMLGALLAISHRSAGAPSALPVVPAGPRVERVK